MTTIRLGTSVNATHRNPNAAAYAALAGGGADNLVLWEKGVRFYLEGGRVWGLVGTQACSKRVHHDVVGSGTNPTFLWDGRLYLNSALHSSTYNAATKVRSFTLLTNGASEIPEGVFFGVGTNPTDLASSVSEGTRRKDALSLAQVGAAGLNFDDVYANGAGVWFAEIVNTDQLLFHIYCPQGGGVPAEEQWGGIAVGASQSANYDQGATRYSPFVFSRSVANDPSGSRVAGGARIWGAVRASVGTPIRASTPAGAGSFGDIIWDSPEIRGGEYCMYAGSNQTGQYFEDSKLIAPNFNQLIDPTIWCNRFGEASSGGEVFSFEDRVRNVEIAGGLVLVGATHGVVSFAYDAPTGEARSFGNTCRDLTAISLYKAYDTRAVTVNDHGTTGNSSRTSILRNIFKGFTTHSQIGGVHTDLICNSFSLAQYALTDTDSSHDLLRFIFASEQETVQDVNFIGNLMDARGCASRGFTQRAVMSIVTAGSGTTNNTANFVRIEGNTLLADAGTDIIACQEQGSSTLFRAQKVIGNWHNGGATPARWVPGGDETWDSEPKISISALFVGGDTTSRPNVAVTAAQAFSLPKRPTMSIEEIVFKGELPIFWELPTTISTGQVVRGRNFITQNISEYGANITTTAPVIFDECRFKGPGRAIRSVNTGTQVYAYNCLGEITSPLGLNEDPQYFVSLWEPKVVVLENNTFKGAGIYLPGGGGYSPAVIRVLRNLAVNLNGLKGSGTRTGFDSWGRVYEVSNSPTYFRATQFIQLVSLPGILDGLIERNKVTNELGKSRPEDLMNFSASSGVVGNRFKVRNNLLHANIPSRIDLPSNSGVGLLFENSCNYFDCDDNRIVLGTLAVNITGGGNTNIRVRRLRAISNGTILGVPLTAANQTSAMYCDSGSTNLFEDCVVGWRGAAGALKIPEGNATLTGLIQLANGVVVEALHAQEIADWHAENDAAGIKIGSSLTPWW